MKAMIAIIVPAAAVMAVMWNAEHALDRPYSPSNAGADRATNDTAHGAGDPVTFIRTLLGPAHDTLGVAGVRQSQ